MKYLIILMMLIIPLKGWAQVTTVVSERVINEADERSARRKAIDEATDAVTEDTVRQEVGQDRYRENKDKIDREIKPAKNRFIPFFKILSSRKEGEGYRFSIEVKVSRSDLRTVLQQKGLFATVEKTGIVLPFIELNNQLNGESFRWWSPFFSTSKELESSSLVFEEELFKGFIGHGLFLLRPQNFRFDNFLPSHFKKSYLDTSEMTQLTQFKRGQLLVDGRVDFFASPVREKAFRIRVQLSCKQASNGKSVAEVVKTFDTGSAQSLSQLQNDIRRLAFESGDDLASQVYDLWQRGALESQSVQLVVKGKLTHHQSQQFKKHLAEKIGARDGVSERLFEPNQITYEMDYNGSVENLKKRLEHGGIGPFSTRVLQVENEQITLEVLSQ